MSHSEGSSGRNQIARKHSAQFAWYEFRFGRTLAGALRRGPSLRRRGHTADPISPLISLNYRTNGAGTMIGTMLKPPHLASRLSFLFAAESRDASKRVIPNLSSDSLNFNFPIKLLANSECYTESYPTKRAAFSYQTDGSVPTKRAYFFYQTGGPLEEARPPATRRGQFLPNGRLALKRPEPAAETAMISYQTEIRGLIPHRRCRNTLGRPGPLAGTDGQGQVPREVLTGCRRASRGRFRAPGAEAAWQGVAAAASNPR